MSDYYRAIILATRSSAKALQAIASLSRRIRDAKHYGSDTMHLYRSLERAKARYARAQEILASHPLSADDIAARQRDYPAPRDPGDVSHRTGHHAQCLCSRCHQARLAE